LQSVLTRPGQSDSQTWQQPLKHLSQVVKPGSKLFLIGDLLQLSEQSLAMIRNVSRHSEVIAIHLFDPLEKKLPKLGWLSLTLSFETDPLLKLDSFRRKTRDNYAEIYAQQWQTMQEQFRQMKLPLLEIGTHEDPLESLMRLKVLV